MGKIKFFTISIVFLFLLLTAAFVGYDLAYKNLIYPNVYIAGIYVGGGETNTVKTILKETFTKNPNSLIITYGNKTFYKVDTLQRQMDFDWAITQAMKIGRSGNLLTQTKERIEVLFSRREVEIPLSFDEDDLKNILEEMISEVTVKPVYPTLEKNSDKIVVTANTNGVIINNEKLKGLVIQKMGRAGKQTLEVPVEIVNTKPSEQQLAEAVRASERWINKELKLKTNELILTLKDTDIIRYFGLDGGRLNEGLFKELTASIEGKVLLETKDAVFQFDGKRVQEFAHEVVGTSLNESEFKKIFTERLYDGASEELTIPLNLTQPKITTEQINNLGIKELIGKGSSMFGHSIPGRVFNVNLAASRINGVLVAPGETFSFNNSVGEISKATGYQSAYIISEGKTVLGDGGGVCQVSTTVFRAALNAGLPITERKAHAYRVGYYEQDSKPGIDATVFSPSADLKFQNNTENYILIQTKVDTKKLTMEVDIYGTADGRQVSLSEPRISGYVPAPATLYVDDPTLPAGTMKQIDWSAPGTKAAFDYKVEKGGQIIFEKTFYSNYQPWRAVFLRGTGQ